ncbi:hypothetical protein LJR235_002911 [Pararhizobium sp. LjRoot235]|uniref:hypothetical protein n=1 Tax=Pararhizobium sp. LjRoot235 TaxID=3342291 RepID=UPI003ECD9E17
MIAQETDKVLGSHDKDLGFKPKRQKQNRGKVMSAVFEARSLFRDAFPQERYGKLENVFYEARRFMNELLEKDFTLRRARSIWEGTVRRIDSEEMDALRLAVIEESRREKEELRARLDALDEKLAAYEAASHRETMAG